MSSTSSATRELAGRLIALETAMVPEQVGCEATRVCDKLRVSLVKFAGVSGYRSLISRAVALAKLEMPSLGALQVEADGTLDGLDAIEQSHPNAGAVVVNTLLSLLVTFIGKTLTISLIKDAWPETSLSLGESDIRAEEQS